MVDYQSFFKGKRITLMGLGVLGRGVGDARFLAELGAELIVTDLKSESDLAVSLATLRTFPNVQFHLEGHRLGDFENRDLIIKAAGVPLDSPFIAHAKAHGIPVRMSADLFVELAQIPTVGITGTRGKSTTTYLIAHIARQGRWDVILGGNIKGVSTLSLLPSVTDNSLAVLELDSWQLQGFGESGQSPQVAVFTTFLPDHLNYYHGDLRAYFADKANVFLNQNGDDTLVLSEQVVPYVREYGYQRKIRAHTVIATERDLPKKVRLRIPGEHNRLNAAVASVVARALHVDDSVLRQALESFTGVPGRLELVREVRSVKIYNDTTATVPEATMAALKAVGDPKIKHIVLIMGGSDKGLDMGTLIAEVPKYCKKVLLLEGTGTERVREQLPGAKVYDSMRVAVQEGFAMAAPGDVLLMSPGFASFGMFQNEYDRGEQFDQAVAALH